MAVKIRLQRKGRKKRPFYHIVVADARAPRDGRFIEKLGIYNPMTSPATIDLDRDKAFDWLMKGAQPTETARAILRFKGVLYRKHLMRGVSKGALTQEEADLKYQEWIAAKEAKIQARVDQNKADRLKRLAEISGQAPPKPVAQETASTDEHAPSDTDDRSFAESVEQTTVESFSEPQGIVADAPVEEAAPEAPAEEPAPVEEAPVAEETPAEEAAPEAPAAEVKPDDLKKIEGIGPKISELLQAGGVRTFAELAAADVSRLKEILTEAGSRYQMHDPTTWPQQAALAAEGKWDELNELQDRLDGGKVVD